MTQDILTTTDGCVGLITLNAPAKRNAISLATSEQLADAVGSLEQNTDIKAIVITGASPAFSAGGDLADLVAAREGDAARLKRIYEGFLRVLRCPLPTIAAVNGPAVGAGLNLALACDVRLATPEARFETRFLKIGLHSGGGHSWMLTRAVGPSAAASLLLLGKAVSGVEAERIGLVNACVAAGEDVVAAAIALAKKTADYPRDLLIASKESLRLSETQSHAEIAEREFRLQADSLRQPAFAKAMAAAGVKIKE